MNPVHCVFCGDSIEHPKLPLCMSCDTMRLQNGITAADVLGTKPVRCIICGSVVPRHMNAFMKYTCLHDGTFKEGC